MPATSQNPQTAIAGRILKVNHAGENGAVHIYAGQILLAHLTAPSLVSELVEFKAHEEKHRAIFWAELERRNLPRCRSYWLCAAGGFTLGILTALFGRRAIAANRVLLFIFCDRVYRRSDRSSGRDRGALAGRGEAL